MPSHRAHRLIQRIILGKEYPKVDMALDLPALVKPQGHRRFLHDPLTAVILGSALAGEKGAEAGILHITTDFLASKNKAFASWLEMLAKQKSRSTTHRKRS